jgi:pilus assembly protein Flp/PilA
MDTDRANPRHLATTKSIKGEWLKMTKLYIYLSNLARDERGQDMVEYALLAGFIAVAAGATLPGISTSISTIFSKMASVTSLASTK